MHRSQREQKESILSETKFFNFSQGIISRYMGTMDLYPLKAACFYHSTLLALSPNNLLSSHNNSHKTELLLTNPHWPPIFLEPLSFREIEQMDLYAFIPASLTTALYWLCWYPADQPCLPALVLKVPKTNLKTPIPL